MAKRMRLVTVHLGETVRPDLSRSGLSRTVYRTHYFIVEPRGGYVREFGVYASRNNEWRIRQVCERLESPWQLARQRPPTPLQM